MTLIYTENTLVAHYWWIAKQSESLDAETGYISVYLIKVLMIVLQALLFGGFFVATLYNEWVWISGTRTELTEDTAEM